MNINLSLTPAEALALKILVQNPVHGTNSTGMTTEIRTGIWHKLPRLEWLEAEDCAEYPSPSAYEPGAMIPGIHQPESPEIKDLPSGHIFINPDDDSFIAPSKAWWCESHKRWATYKDAKGPCCAPGLPGILLPCIVALREIQAPVSFELAEENGFPRHL